MMKYKSAYERLLDLPAIFTINTMTRMERVDKSTAKVLLSRWADKKMVEPAGPRAGIYFNKVIDRKGETENPVRALSMKYPSATLCGASVLHSSGWTTQIPTSVHAAIEERPSYVQINGIELHPRPVSWFKLMHSEGAWQGSEDPDFTSYGLRSLSPAWALAEIYADESGKSWVPDEDDLDIPDEAMSKLIHACDVMGATPDWLKRTQYESSRG